LATKAHIDNRKKF